MKSCICKAASSVSGTGNGIF